MITTLNVVVETGIELTKDEALFVADHIIRITQHAITDIKDKRKGEGKEWGYTVDGKEIKVTF